MSLTSNNTTNEWTYHDEDYVLDESIIVLTITPMIVGFLSIVGNWIIIRECIADLTQGKTPGGRADKNSILSKQFISMSVAYSMYACQMLLGEIPAPSFYCDVWLASGTVATCTAMGFFAQFGVFAAALLHTTLVFFYLVIVKYNWTYTRMNRAFNCINWIVWITSFIFAIIPVFLKYYNFTGSHCWLASFPNGCDNDDIPCLRGTRAGVALYNVILSIIPYLPCAVASAVMFCMIYGAVRNVEDRASRYSSMRMMKRLSLQGLSNPRIDSTDESSTTPTGKDATTEAKLNQQQQQQKLIKDGSSKQKSGATEAKVEDDSGTNTDKNNLHEVATKPNNISRSSTKETTKSHQLQTKEEQCVNRSKSKAVAIQGILIAGYILIVVFVAVIHGVVTFLADDATPFALELFNNIMQASPGFINSIIFCRTRSGNEMKTFEGTIYRRILCCWCLRWCCNSSTRHDEEQQDYTTINTS